MTNHTAHADLQNTFHESDEGMVMRLARKTKTASGDPRLVAEIARGVRANFRGDDPGFP